MDLSVRFGHGPAAARLFELCKGYEHGALVLGCGELIVDEGVKIVQHVCRGLPRSFVDDYPDIAKDDVAAHLISNLSSSALQLCTSDYAVRGSTPSGQHVGKYLAAHNVRALMIVGVNSRYYGFAWLTLYRLGPDLKSDKQGRDGEEEKAEQEAALYRFSNADCESASFVLRAAVYECLVESMPRQAVATETSSEHLNSLTPRQLDVVLRLARGYSYQDTADELGITLSGVKNHIKDIAAALDELEPRRFFDKRLGPLKASKTPRSNPGRKSSKRRGP